MSSRKPDSAPDFLLSRADGSVRTQGSVRSFIDAWDAATALDRGEVPMVVGALPFDRDAPAALTVPESIIREPGTLEPHAYYRTGEGAALSARVTGYDPEPHEHLRRIEAAVATINDSLLDKVVLARAVDIAFNPPVDPRTVAARLIDLSRTRDGFIADLTPAGKHGHMIAGSSPEQLVKREGLKVTSYPLAGSAARVAGDPAADEAAGQALANSQKDLDEHAFVVEHIREILAPLCDDLSIPSRPVLTKTNEMWHLATPITGTLRTPAPNALDLAARLYPTPAVCGTPQHAAEALITTAESDRSFYAGTVGWCDDNGDGEFMVSIRCAEVSGDGTAARAWAGGGLVAASDPEAELAETTAKLRTIQRALGL
ncbi:isochorismate synthase [Corynebacterium appendicis CIP 107643]|uniref:isochorismate synthase n=1 Tax=Corynebacterium appendicis CIP 107643 TaxID=1161099 RepID=A0A1N7IUG9_9CORY|nr:isochorismate synthase [Corynebacterium appendicis]WJY60973.1 Isochorismate synthase DhbC [Corynebacterium appendicis CIP 107643]SIS40714.1 isochorismate synthase [Corynebacterium appendicis CIP 107643]